MIVTARKHATIATRRSEALKMFYAGSTMRQIAEVLNCSLGTVSGDIQAELKNHADETRQALRMQKQEEFAALSQTQTAVRTRIVAVKRRPAFYHRAGILSSLVG